MAVTIQVFEFGDTDYIAKHNANYQNIKVAVESLQAAIGGGDPDASLPAAYKALFGEANSAIGEGSYLPSQSAAHSLSVAAGYSFVAASTQVVVKTSATVLDFTGQSTDTFYIHVDATGEPSFSATATGALYQVDYDSATGDFSNIARYGNLSWAYVDWEDAQTNLWNMTYDSFDGRLTGIEGAAFGVLSKTAVATDITLTTDEALEQSIIKIADGPQTADINLVVPAQARVYQILSEASSSYEITVKTAAGTGYVVGGNHYVILYCDGVDTVALFDLNRAGGNANPPDEFTDLTDTPNGYTGFGLRDIRVKLDETGLEYYVSDYKRRVVAKTTTNITLSGEQSLDNIALVTGDRALVSGQTAASENGIYIVDTGAWTRAKDADAWDSLVSARVSIERGNTLADTHWYCTVDTGGTLGTTDVTFVQDGAGGIYMVSGFSPGKPTIDATILVHVFAVATTFPSSLTGSQGTAETAATAQTDFNIKKNGISVGTMRFAASGSTATFIMASETSFAVGDKMQIVAPGPQDSTLFDIAYSLKGAR